MAKQKQAAPYEQMLGFLRETYATEPCLNDVLKLGELAAESMQAFCASLDSSLQKELRDIARYIETMKAEIGHFQANDLKESRIPAAGEELNAVVKSTEDATNTIMECAEALMAADMKDMKEYRAYVMSHVTRIFEACSFQDITGQRVAKVVETLQMIEGRVARFAEAVHAKDVSGFINEKEATRAKRKERLMLNGPQLSGRGNDQSNVDKLFG